MSHTDTTYTTIYKAVLQDVDVTTGPLKVAIQGFSSVQL